MAGGGVTVFRSDLGARCGGRACSTASGKHVLGRQLELGYECANLGNGVVQSGLTGFADLQVQGFTLFEQLIGDGMVTAKEKSILGRCTEQVYLPYIRNGYKGTPPTLQDFYRLLQMQPEPEAQGLALSSELFITGTLNTFARHTNVDTQARIIAYDIRELGEQLMPLGMLVTLDAIYNRVIQNWKKGRRTWIFCDEFYRARRSVT